MSLRIFDFNCAGTDLEEGSSDLTDTMTYIKDNFSVSGDISVIVRVDGGKVVDGYVIPTPKQSENEQAVEAAVKKLTRPNWRYTVSERDFVQSDVVTPGLAEGDIWRLAAGFLAGVIAGSGAGLLVGTGTGATVGLVGGPIGAAVGGLVLGAGGTVAGGVIGGGIQLYRLTVDEVGRRLADDLREIRKYVGNGSWVIATTYQPNAAEEEMMREANRVAEDFMRAKPTKIELQKSEELKQNIASAAAKAVVGTLQKVIESKGGAFLLNESESDLMNLPNIFLALSSPSRHASDLMIVLKLKPIDFDSRGDMYNFAGITDKRGGMTYKQPSSRWIRVGLRVRNLYDDNDWLAMDGREGEWAVGFHGSSAAGSMGIAQSREFWVHGRGQMYAMSKDKNVLGDNYGRQCGTGAYFAESIETSAGGYSEIIKFGNDDVKLVFQVRLNPKKVRIPSERTDYRIVPSVDDARPYGICIRKTYCSII